jgi:Protein of unknown function (DUF4089)
VTDQSKNIDVWIDAVAPIINLEIAAQHRPGVRANLEVAIRMAERIEAVRLEDESEPAPVYRA